MPNLTDNELRAVAYYAIGVSSEGSDVAYQLSFCGNPMPNKPDGSGVLKPIGNSGYTIGEMQTDFGADKASAQALVNSFQAWAKATHPDWVLKDQEASRLASDLGRDGRHIRDPSYDADNKKYMEAHAGDHIPNKLLPESGQDIDQTFKSRLNSYLATDEGKTFVHQQDIKQVDTLKEIVGDRLEKSAFYKNASPEDQARIFAVVAKAYNQGPVYVLGSKNVTGIFNDIDGGRISNLSDVNRKIDTFPPYMRSGRDDALAGAETFNALRDASERNAMHEPWQAIVANPLVNPTELGADPKHPDLADQYATVKGVFVAPTQGRAFVEALEKGGSYNSGDPAKSNSRGFYAEGSDFVQWDKSGKGRAFVGSQWTEFSRSEIVLAPNKDHTLDVNINRGGETHSLLHLMHPSGHSRSQPLDHSSREAGMLRQGMHSESVRKLQTQLGELGYLDNVNAPDGKFGPTTAKAVQSFQHDHHLPEVGRAGPATQQAIQAGLAPLAEHNSGPLPAVPAMSSLTSAPGIDDPRSGFNANHTLYSKLQQRLPDASEERLLQFTAACHANKITGENLSGIHLDETNMKIGFHGSSFLSTPATVDLNTPPPQPQQAIQQIQQHDQQQAQMTGQIQAQNAQVNQQASQVQGPTPGGPSR